MSDCYFDDEPLVPERNDKVGTYVTKGHLNLAWSFPVNCAFSTEVNILFTGQDVGPTNQAGCTEMASVEQYLLRHDVHSSFEGRLAVAFRLMRKMPNVYVAALGDEWALAGGTMKWACIIAGERACLYNPPLAIDGERNS